MSTTTSSGVSFTRGTIYTYGELSHMVAAWAAYNFAVGLPHLGIVEEIGELAHALLKSEQGIRGMADKDKAFAALKDALADVGIFALHYCGLHDIDPDSNMVRAVVGTPTAMLANLSKLAATILDATEHKLFHGAVHAIDELFKQLENFAQFYGLNFLDLVNEVAQTEVLPRDWKKYPETGWPAPGTEVCPHDGDMDTCPGCNAQ